MARPKKRVKKRKAAVKKTASKKSSSAPATAPKTGEAAAGKLIPPPNAVTIRIYRIGHGDCHLLAFPGDAPDKPVYILIDCGYKPGSSKKMKNPTTAKEIAADIKAATSGHIDVAIITHEHQDHVNGISESNFAGITIGEAWFAWTENPNDDVAKDLRRKYKDKLLGLLEARNRLAADEAAKIDDFLAFELGGEDEVFNAAVATQMLGAAGGAAQSMNKRSMKVFKDLATEGVKFLRPHETIHGIPRAKNLRIFSLGPPRDPELLTDLDPEGTEEFHSLALAAASAGNFFAAAAAGKSASPFPGRYCIAMDQAVLDANDGAFFHSYYGTDAIPPSHPPGWPIWSDEVTGNPGWRRIDKDWLLSAEQLALDMNDYTNNASLVLAFELGKGGKVLLFPADAQRGSWMSWSKKDFKDGKETVNARDLLARTVFYKVGHHGSHNATLNGTDKDDYPNLAWMAQGEYQREFTAMITAVRAWAETQKGWDHPLKAIKDALLKKAAGRVFQTDTDFEDMKMLDGSSNLDWNKFHSRTKGARLYFDYTIKF